MSRFSLCNIIICLDNQISISTLLSEKTVLSDARLQCAKKKIIKDSPPNVGHLDFEYFMQYARASKPIPFYV